MASAYQSGFCPANYEVDWNLHHKSLPPLTANSLINSGRISKPDYKEKDNEQAPIPAPDP
jgi:hypothetical protein